MPGNFSILARGGLHDDKPEEKYVIIGGDAQIINVKLLPGDSVRCEPGVLMHMDPHITPSTSFACSCKRWCSGEDQWSTTFTNGSSSDAAIIGLTPNRPSKVIPIDLGFLKAGGASGIYTKQGAWMANVGDVNVSYSADCNCARVCCAGQGLIRMFLKGSGTAFIEGHGSIMTKTLAAGEKLVVDQQSILAWAETVNLNFRRAGGCCTMCCSGEGMFNAVLDGGDTGGIVILESMPFEKYQQAIVSPNAMQRGGQTNNHN